MINDLNKLLNFKILIRFPLFYYSSLSQIRKFFALAPVGRLAHVHGLFYYLGKMYDQIKVLFAIITTAFCKTKLSKNSLVIYAPGYFITNAIA